MIFLDETDFPDFPSSELADEFGLLAIGGKLNVEWLVEAYFRGIFPWFDEDEPIHWWTPPMRAVMKPSDVKIQKSMRSIFNGKKFELRIDTAFEEVIKHCATVPREGQNGTWITKEMQQAYIDLHNHGYAHSFETWQDGKLVGGLYGVAIKKVFSGESMFSLVSNSSKFAFISMCKILEKHNFWLIDCQFPTNHLQSLGCGITSRNDFEVILLLSGQAPKGKWTYMTDDI